MKRFAALLLWIVLAALPAHAKDDFPPLTGRVVDAAHVIDANTAVRLDAMLAAHEKKTTDQIVVVTLPSLHGDDIADLGYRLGRAWGIGQKGKNNGALLIVAPNERKVRIEVGYGLEGTLTDAASSLIIQNVILPHFKAGDMPGGIAAGAQAMLATLGDTDAGPVPAAMQEQAPSIPLIIIIIVFVILFSRGGFLLPLLFGLSRGGGGGNDSGGFSGGGGSFGGGGSSGSW